jgi:hypothetical protein
VQKAAPPAIPQAQNSPEPGEYLSYWKSKDFATEIHSLTIGDVNGDGQNETVFVDGNIIYVHGYAEKEFTQLASIPLRSHNEFIRVDAADINRNGIAEIFITNYVPNYRLMRSFVMEWNGSSYEKISQNAKWYYRVVTGPEGSAVLLGQKAGSWQSIISVKDALFDTDIFELQWQDGKYRPAKKLNLPEGMILYGNATGDAANNGQNKIAAFSKSNYLTLLNSNGVKEWESDEPYGGGTLFFEVTDPGDRDRTQYFYLPQRLFLTDFDGDGANEIVVVKNHDAARSLARVVYYKEGTIECLSYDDIGIQLKWQTRKVSGYISDYAIGDFDNDGQNDLVFASVTKKKSVLNKGLSAIIVCSLAK